MTDRYAAGYRAAMARHGLPARERFVLPQVEAACELLGLDPLYVANEGKLIVICAGADAERVLREKFSALTAGRNEIIKASVAAQPALLLRCAT